jgi:uncharacterized phosphosugar-binding protein
MDSLPSTSTVRHFSRLPDRRPPPSKWPRDSPQFAGVQFYCPLSQRPSRWPFSVSGVNSVPVEVAAESRSRGLPVIAITSQSYCRAVAEARGLARTLITEADLVIDNHVPIGDAVVPIPHSNFRAASTSTIAASLIYHLLLEQILKHLTQRDVCIPIFASSNLPSAQAHNAELIARYRKRVRNF